MFGKEEEWSHRQKCEQQKISQHRFSLVSLGPRANAETVPFYVPSCRYMLPV